MTHPQIDFRHEALRKYMQNYAPLAEVEWKRLSTKLKVKTIPKNEILLNSGEICDKVWFISKGLIRYYQIDGEQHERTTCFAMENQFFTAFSSYLRDSPSHEVLVALEETEVIEISKGDFLSFLDTIPSINLLYRHLMEEAYLQMENLSFALQHYTALERYKRLIISDAPELLKRVPLVYLASYIGISPETLSRVRAKI